MIINTLSLFNMYLLYESKCAYIKSTPKRLQFDTNDNRYIMIV